KSEALWNNQINEIIYTPVRFTIEPLFGSHFLGDGSSLGLDAHPIPSRVSPTIRRDIHIILH
ncbi:hypothetical protein DOS64_10385, partial [Staphylococcus felis]